MARLLFLTATDPSKKDYWNQQLPPALSTCGIDTTVAAWTSPEDELIELAVQHSHICLFTAAHYNDNLTEFKYLLQELIPAIQARAPQIKVMNSAELTHWNHDKSYLCDLQEAGFLLPRTLLYDTNRLRDDLAEALQHWLQHTQPGTQRPIAAVVKPSVGASGLHVNRIKDCEHPTENEIDALKPLLESTSETVVFQEFLPDIQVNGELSLIYVGGKYVAAAIKKVNRVLVDEFRINSEYGGSSSILPDSDVPATAIAVGDSIISWLEARFGAGSCAYMRLDGVVRGSDGAFVTMEVECIEPSFMLREDQMLQKVVTAFAEMVQR